MSTEPSMDAHDFEVISSPEASAALPKNPAPTPATENDRSIRDLFDKPNEPSFVQTLAKVFIFASIPHQVFWSAVTAIFVAICQPTPNDETPLDQLVLRQITLHTKDRLDRCQTRLEWVDKDLPAVVEKCNDHISKTAKQIKAAKDEATRKAGLAVPRISRIALFAIAVPFVFPFLFSRGSWFKAPVVIWLGLGYWFGKRRERRARMGSRFTSWIGTGPEGVYMRR